MAIRNQAITIGYVAWDTSAQTGKTGDATNHTLKVVLDGIESDANNTPAELDAINCPGIYLLALDASETNGNTILVAGKSSTSNVSIQPVQLTTESNGGGANTVTLTFTDGSNPAQGLSITIKNSGETAKVAGPSITDISGEIVFNLDDGNYKVLVASNNVYEPLAAQSLTVSGTTTDSYVLSQYNVPAPSDPTLCRVYGYIVDLNNEPLSGTQVIFKLKDPVSTAISTSVVSIETLVVRTNNDGYFYADLIRSGQFATSTDYKVICEKVGLKETITVPNSASASLSSLLA